MLLKKTALFVTYCPTYTLVLNTTRLPPIIHNILGITLHISVRHSIKTQQIPQFTSFLSKTYIHLTMWYQSNKAMAAWIHCIRTARIKAPGRPPLLTRHHLTILEASTFLTKNACSSKHYTKFYHLPYYLLCDIHT